MIIEYSPKAEFNLGEILDYGYEHWGLQPALEFVDALRQNINILLEYPNMGATYDLDKLTKNTENLRVLTHGNYQIVYEILKSVIRIHAVNPKGRPPT